MAKNKTHIKSTNFWDLAAKGKHVQYVDGMGNVIDINKPDILEQLKPYLHHLPSCNIKQDWSEAEQALSDTPDKYKDENWQSAYDEMRVKMNTCTCGLHKILEDKSINDKWISVKDNLPLKDQRVLCVQNPETTATRQALFAIFDGKRFNDPEATMDGIHKCIAHWVDIIYWMPLPKIQKK